MGLAEVGGVDICSVKNGSAEVGSAEVGSAEVGGVDICSVKNGSAEVRGVEVRGVEVGGVEVGVSKRQKGHRKTDRLRLSWASTQWSAQSVQSS